jgi:hypothetical protein
VLLQRGTQLLPGVRGLIKGVQGTVKRLPGWRDGPCFTCELAWDRVFLPRAGEVAPRTARELLNADLLLDGLALLVTDVRWRWGHMAWPR